MTTLHGIQYVRLAPGAAEAIARYLNAQPAEIDELVLDLDRWPEEIHPAPLRARDGRLLAGDPVLIDATEDGLILARSASEPAPVLVHWRNVREVAVIGTCR